MYDVRRNTGYPARKLQNEAA